MVKPLLHIRIINQNQELFYHLLLQRILRTIFIWKYVILCNTFVSIYDLIHLNLIPFHHQKILVGFEHSKQFHVFELTRQLPKFAMYAAVSDFVPSRDLQGPVQINENTSYVSFKLNERYQRLCLWINQVWFELKSFNLMYCN